MSCTRTPRTLAALDGGGALDEGLARHVRGCDDCARAVTAAQLTARGLMPEPEAADDDAVFAALGLGAWPAGASPADRDFLGELVHAPTGAMPAPPAEPAPVADRPSALSMPVASIPPEEMIDLPLPPAPVAALYAPPAPRRRAWGAWLAGGGALAAALLAFVAVQMTVMSGDEPVPSMTAADAPAKVSVQPAAPPADGEKAAAAAKAADEKAAAEAKAADEKPAAGAGPDAQTLAAVDAGAQDGADDGEDGQKAAAAAPKASRRAPRRSRAPSTTKPAEAPAPKPAARKPAPKKESTSEVDDLLGALDGSGGGSKTRAASPAAAAPGAAADPLVPEQLTRRQILAVVKRNARAVTRCKEGTDASGTVPVELVIGRSGRVTSATVSSGPQKGTPVGACIERMVRSFRFPQFSGDPMRIVMPFAL